MNGHVTETRLKSIIDLHAALPQADLRRGDSIIISSTKLALGESLEIGWLSLQIIKINLTEDTPTRIINSLGFVYAGLFMGGFDPLRRPSGMPTNFISLNGPNVKLMSPYTRRSFAGPDIVTLIVINNTVDTDVEIMLAGSMKLYTKS